jgi:hypothetical protein
MKTTKSTPSKAYMPTAFLNSTVDGISDPLKSFTEGRAFQEYMKLYNGKFPAKKDHHKNWFIYLNPKEKSTHKFIDTFAIDIDFQALWRDDNFQEVLASTKEFSPEVFVELTRRFFTEIESCVTTDGKCYTLAFQHEAFQDKRGFLDYIEYYIDNLPENINPTKLTRKVILDWITDERRKLNKRNNKPQAAHLSFAQLFGNEKDFNEVLRILEEYDRVITKDDDGQYYWKKLTHGSLVKIAALAYFLYHKGLIKDNGAKVARAIIAFFHLKDYIEQEPNGRVNFEKNFQDNVQKNYGFEAHFDSFEHLERWIDSRNSTR